MGKFFQLIARLNLLQTVPPILVGIATFLRSFRTKK